MGPSDRTSIRPLSVEKDLLLADKTRHTLSKLEPGDFAEAARRTPGLIPRSPRPIFRALLGVLLSFFCGMLFVVRA